jgi:hypothetical protein
LLAAPKTSRGPEGKPLGPHPIDNQPVQLMEGRYGPYIKHGKVTVTVPSDMDVATLSLDDAVDLLAEKAAKELAKTGSTAAPPIPAQRPANQRGRGLRGDGAPRSGTGGPRAGAGGAQRGGGGMSRGGGGGGGAKRAGAGQTNPAAGNRGGGKGKPGSHPQRQPAQRAAAARSGARRRPA